MKHGWQKTIFDKVCTIYTGNSINENIKNIKYRNLSKGYNYISTKDIGLNYNINYENGVKIPFSENCFKIAPANTPLLCIEGGSAGKKIGITNQAVCFVNKLCAFVNDKKIVESKFLFYYLQTQFFKQNFYNNKTGLIGGVSVGKMKKLPVKFPVNISEQKRIVKILDKAFEDIEKIKENAKKNLQNSKDLFQNYLNKLLVGNSRNWIHCKVKNITKLIQYGYTESASFKNVGPKFLRITDIQDNNVNWNDVPYCKILENDKKKYLLANGDLLFARTGATVGKSYFIENLKYESVFASYLIRLSFNTNLVYPKFIKYFFNSDEYWKQILDKQTGTGQPNVNGTKLSLLNINYPPLLSEQKQIVKKLDMLQEKTKKLEEIYNKKLQLAEELKQSILHKAFNGEL